MRRSSSPKETFSVAAVMLSTLHSCSLSSTSLPHLRRCDAAAAAAGGSIRCLSSPSPTPPTTAFSPENLKKFAADKAVEYVKSGMVLGLGTGITVGFVVAEIGALLSAGKLRGIVGVPTSKRTFELAKSAGIPLSTLDEHPRLDLAIDGADEVDPDLNLVKGRGGALLREKMVESASAKFLVVGDESKLVTNLGGSGLAVPVEVVQFCWKYNQTRLQGLFKDEGCSAKLRLDADGKPYVTDNSNYIVDLYFKTPIKDLNAAGIEISALEGVVEHGFFLDMANEVIIAGKEGLSIKTNFAAMVKAGKWLRSILTGKKENNQEKEMEGRIWLHLPPSPPPPPTTPEDKKSRSFQLEMEKQNPAVQFALLPANRSWFEPELEKRWHSMALTSATEVDFYVGMVAARKASFSTIEDVAAIMIQASFRSFLARKALRALKGLVKLQAVVRGFLVRKQAAATLRSMQALLIAQARARARRVRMVEEVDAAPCRESSQRRLMGEFNFQQLLNMDRTVDMIVEMDKGQSKGNSKSRKISNPITQSDTKEPRAFSYQKISSGPSALTDMSSCSAQFESSSTAARCRFHYSSLSHKPGRMRSPDEIIMQEGSYLMSHEFPLFPNHMANTESRRAKARSQSAPRQTPDAFDQKQSCKESTSFGGRNSNRAAWVQQS